MPRRLVFLLRRLPSSTREEFQRYWSVNHAPLVAGVAETLGISRYQQVHTVRDGRPGTVAGFDGVAELWFDSAQGTGTPAERQRAADILLADERRFIDLAASPIWLADEVVMRVGDTDGLRMTAALRRRPGLSRREFRDHWRDVHGPLALQHPEVFGFRHYVQLHTPDDAETFPPAVVRGAPAPFDGLSEIWLDDVNPDPEHAATVRAMIMTDEATFLDYEASPIFFGRVDVIVGGF